MTYEKRQIKIESIAIKRRLDVTLTDTNIATFAVCSIFLPYVLAGLVLVFLAIYIAVNKHTREKIFVHKGSKTMKLFFAFTLIVPMIYRNWLGLLAGFGLVLAMIMGMFLRTIMTKALYEKILTLICILSLTSASFAITEKFVLSLASNRFSSHRISAAFLHPNYFGTIISMVIIICAYKIFTNQEQKWMYYVIALLNVVSLYLCKSMFAFVEVFVGVAALMFLLKKYKLLTAWLSTAALAGFLIFFLNIDIIPRLSDVEVTVRLRTQIWQLAAVQIKKTPLFGEGLLTFIHIYKSYYRNQVIPHAHNLYLDLILNFGVVGTVLFLWYFIKYFITLTTKCFKEKETMITSLILAVIAATLVHGVTDITILWIQTLPLLFILLSGLGAYEKTEESVVEPNSNILPELNKVTLKESGK